MNHEYAFDIKMFAIVRINAPDPKTARAALLRCIDQAGIAIELAEQDRALSLSDATITVDDEGGPYLFEVDGEDV